MKTSRPLLLSVALLALPAFAEVVPLESRFVGVLPHDGPRIGRDLSTAFTPRTGDERHEATHEGKAYWAARKVWEDARALDTPPPDMLRAVAEAAYRERLRGRLVDGKLVPLEASAAAAGWRSLGPTNYGGRTRDLAFTPDRSKLYMATANGGIWLLTRQGDDYVNPRNLTNDLPLLTFGAVAVAPSNPSIVYAATGEGSPMSGNQVLGYGTLRSTDGGETWAFNTQSVQGGTSSLVPSVYSYDLDVNPNDPSDVVLGTYDGIFRTRDGGRTWVNRFPSQQAGQGNIQVIRQGVNFARRPDNPNVIWAGLWGGIAVSNDGGDTWQPGFENVAQQVGYPGIPIRSLVAISPANPDRIYWLVAGALNQGGYSHVGLFRSDNGGQSFGTAYPAPAADAGRDDTLTGDQGWTFLALAVDPLNADRVYAGGLDVWRSENGGLAFTKISDWRQEPRTPHYCHADINVLAFEPGSSTFWVGSDGGVYRSLNQGKSFVWKNDGIVVRMLSSLAQHPTDPYLLYAGTQDNGTNKLRGDNPAAWDEVLGGDGYDCAVDHRSPNVVYATNYNNWTNRADDGGAGKGSFRSLNCPDTAQTLEQCTPPPVTTFRSRLAMDPVDSGVLYAMTDRLYRTTNGARGPDDWRPIYQEYFCSDGPSAQPCPTAQKGYASCASISVNPRDPNRVVFATQAGYLVYTLNGFTNGTIRPIGAEVNTIVWDPNDSDAVFVGLESATELVQGQGAHTIWRIGNLSGQQTAAPRDSGIALRITYAGGTASYAAPVDSLAVSPTDPNLWFAGTKYGIFRSTDGTATWSRFGDDFPATWVSALLFTPDGTKLRAATWGRGLWEINPLGGTPGPTSPPAPAFTWTPQAPRPGQTITFQDGSSGGAASWSWDFGDGTTSTLQNPTKVFAAPGAYNVRLTAGNQAGSRTASQTVTVSYGDTGTGNVYTYLVPVVLTSGGAGGSYYTTELTLVNRAGKPLNLTFRTAGTFEASSTFTLPPGQQVRPDVFEFLKAQTGMAVPDGTKVTTLRIEVRGADNLVQFGALVRVTTPATDALRQQGILGRFGLAFAARPLGRSAKSEAILFGLQQTSLAGSPGTRSNLACVNAGGGSGGNVKLEVTYTFSAENPDGSVTTAVLPDKDEFDLAPFQWDQRSEPLRARGKVGPGGGYARIRKVAGDGEFLCYAVLNDNLNSDGAFVPMVTNDEASKTSVAIVPVVLEASGYTSEMTFANRTARTISGLFALVPFSDPQPQWGYFNLGPGDQFTVPNIVATLRDLGFVAPAGTVASVVFQFLDGQFRDDQSDTQKRIPTSDGFIGVRTVTTKAGGNFGLAYGYSPLGEAADTEAWIYGLQQSGERGKEGGTRSNLAVVHALGGAVSDLTLDVTYYASDGTELGKEAQCNPCTLQPGEWRQFNTPLDRNFPGRGVTNGFARIRRVGGTDQFIAYGVLNDQGNDDGSFVPMIVP